MGGGGGEKHLNIIAKRKRHSVFLTPCFWFRYVEIPVKVFHVLIAGGYLGQRRYGGMGDLW